MILMAEHGIQVPCDGAVHGVVYNRAFGKSLFTSSVPNPVSQRYLSEGLATCQGSILLQTAHV